MRLPVDPTGVRRQNRLQEGGLLKRDSPSQTVPRTPKHCPTQRSPTGKDLYNLSRILTIRPAQIFLRKLGQTPQETLDQKVTGLQF